MGEGMGERGYGVRERVWEGIVCVVSERDGCV